jgi:hypothetical protein
LASPYGNFIATFLKHISIPFRTIARIPMIRTHDDDLHHPVHATICQGILRADAENPAHSEMN